MIHFKPIELSDKPQIEACLDGNTFRSCNFSFTNLFTWNAKFKTQYDILHKTLFIKFQDIDGSTYYMMPIGAMPLNESIQLLQADAKASGIPFRTKGVTLEMWEMVDTTMPGQFKYMHERNNAEYIYLSSKLISLSGKKLQSKRNHINRFKIDNPNWHYFPLTSKTELDECAAMLDEWENFKEDTDKTLQYDYIATRLMLEHFDYLQLKGGAIRVNGKIIAFTIGEKLTEDTFVVHVEKAFGEINGAYTIVNQQFIEHEAAHFKYVNREEDMGIESLRKAKLSYQPDILLEEGLMIPC